MALLQTNDHIRLQGAHDHMHVILFILDNEENMSSSSLKKTRKRSPANVNKKPKKPTNPRENTIGKRKIKRSLVYPNTIIQSSFL